MSAMIKEDPFVKKDDTKKPSDDTTATGTDADSNPIPAATSTDAPATSSDAVSTDGSEPIPTTYITVPMRKARSAYYDDNDRVAQTTNYDYITVNTDYFNDAAFIGDSRIEGLHDYGTLRTKTTADFYYKDGVSIWDLMDKTMANGETIPNVLATKQYKKNLPHVWCQRARKRLRQGLSGAVQESVGSDSGITARCCDLCDGV